MANAAIFDGLVLALERGEITEAEFYAALDEAKRMQASASPGQPSAPEGDVLPEVTSFRTSFIRKNFFKIAAIGLFMLPSVVINPLVLIVYVVIVAAMAIWSWISHDVTVQDGMLLAEDGIIAKSSTRIKVANIRSLDVRQSVWQRLVGIGDLAVTTAGDRPERVLRGITRPSHLANLLSPV